MTDKNPLAHCSGVLSEAVQESAAETGKAGQPSELISTLWEAIGHHSAQVAETGEMAPGQKLLDAARAVEMAIRPPAIATLPEGDYLEGVNIPNLREALIFLGRENGVGEGEVGDKLAQYVNSVVSGVLSKKATLRETPQAAPAAVAVPDERAAFESKFKHLDFSQQPDAWGQARYAHDAISLAWEAWQARAALAATPAVEQIAETITNNFRDAGWSMGSIDDARVLEAVKSALTTTPAAAPAEGFELWWEDHMPSATQAEAWAAWVALHNDSAAAAPAVLTEQDAILLNQAIELLEDLSGEKRRRGDDSTAEGAACSAHAVQRLGTALLAGVSAPAAQAGFVPAAAYDRLQALCDSQAARILAVEDANPVHWLAVLDPEQVPRQLKTSMHAVGFRNPRSAESWIAERLDFDGWRYTLEPLYSAPKAQSDAREAQLLAFAVSEIRRDEMTDSALLDAMEQKRIAVVPEYEGPWDAEIYNDEGKPNHRGSGSTPREAIRAAIAAAKEE